MGRQILILWVLLAMAPVASAESFRPLTVTDLAGRHFQLPSPTAKATVLLFIAHDCPISSSYAPTLNKLNGEYAPRGIAFFLVYAEPGLSAVQARQHIRQYGYQCPALLDSWRALVQETGVTTTPEAAVLAPDGRLLYRGRIDNWFADFGVQRSAASVRDLQEALNAVLQKKPVRQARTKPLGCFIDTHT